MPITQLQAVGFEQESTYGVFASPTTFMPVSSADVGTTQKITRPTIRAAHRGQKRDERIGIETGVSISADLYPEQFTALIAGAFGNGSDDNVSGSSGAGYTHALELANTLPSFSVEIANDWDSQLLSRQIVGCMVDQFTVRGSAQNLLGFEAQLIGQAERTPATPGLPSFATPTYADVDPMDFSTVAMTYNSGAEPDLLDFNYSLQNGVQRVFTANQELYVARLVPTMRTVTLSASFDFVDLTQFVDWRDQAIREVTIAASGDTMTGTSNPYVVSATFRRLRAQDQFDLNDANSVLTAALTFSATVGQNADEFEMTVVNLESGALV